MHEGERALEAELGAAPPPGLAEAVADEDLRRLAEIVGGTRREQSREMAAAGEAGLRFVPALLRGPVKKIVGLR